MTLDFDISELCISGDPIPVQIADKLLHHHILPMQAVRDELRHLQPGFWITASQKSGYRPYRWEIAKGRSGASQHTFGEKKSAAIYKDEWGAVDWTCTDFEKNKTAFLNAILSKTGYTRLALYKTFIHCDYKARNGKRYVYDSDAKSNWTLKVVYE